jgi:hypothetical protein
MNRERNMNTVKVIVELWISPEAMKRNEEDCGFDMGEDPVSDAESLVRARVDSITAGVAMRVTSRRARNIPEDAERF